VVWHQRAISMKLNMSSVESTCAPILWLTKGKYHLCAASACTMLHMQAAGILHDQT
jgi:hypothetical protein